MTGQGPCCPGGSCGEGADRREFLGSVAAFGLLRAAQGAQGPDGDHHVPADKDLPPEWTAALTKADPGKPWGLSWSGEQLRTVAMPCGGVAAGQLYVTGDGRLAQWWIANDACHTSSGGSQKIETPSGEQGVCYGSYAPARTVQQGTLLAWSEPGGETHVLALDRDDFPATTFLGWYPVATIDYRRQSDVPPVGVVAEVFSPFVPLSARASATPATLLRYTVANQGTRPLQVTLAPFLQNPVLRSQRGELRAELRNVAVRQDRFAAVAMDAVEPPPADAQGGTTVVFADFEQGYGDWRVEQGEAFGDSPAQGTLADQQPVSGQHGERLVNTFLGGDRAQGLLVSPEFTIEQPYIAFRIGGGCHRENLALTLELVQPDGRARARAATGRDREALRETFWDVRDLRGRRAVLTVRDFATGPWGHVNVDYIRFCSDPADAPPVVQSGPQAGQVALVALDDGGVPLPGAGTVALLRQRLAAPAPAPAAPAAHAPLADDLLGAITQTVALQPGETKVLTFAVTWFFPNRRQRPDEWLRPGQQCGADGPVVGNMYANWFRSALDVAQHLADHGRQLVRDTFDFVAALYTGTLPGWFVQRVAAPLSTLATATLQWWQDGRVWAWEGVGCCPGTCGHVWNYAQGMAWLFPELERSVRLAQDFAAGVGLNDDGAIGFRGKGHGWAADAQAGYVLKAWREHRLAADGAFLARAWPGVRAALEFLLRQDGEQPDGLLEGAQHNTYDIEFFGANTMVGSLYLAALRAGARMAALRGDGALAARLAGLAEQGAALTMQRLWNGEYFVQQLPAGHEQARFQYGDGCLSDQLLGQWFADQVGLGSLYPEDAVAKALQSIWRYNWAPDIGPQARAHAPERDFAHAGEGGLFVCTWPKGRHRGKDGVRYRDEVWTGIEYQVAASLLRRGFFTQGLAIVRAIHERYDGRKHNPFNEVECGDHYARALASWSCLLAVAGFECDVPAGTFGYAPQLSAGDFRCFFSAGTGWGTIAQRRETGSDGEQQTQTITLQRGALRLQALRFQVPERKRVVGATLIAPGRAGERGEAVRFTQDGAQVEVSPAPELLLHAGAAPDAPVAAIVQLLLA